ncbi:hypothetical protein ACJW31_03G049500 [Castanea mollissima]
MDLHELVHRFNLQPPRSCVLEQGEPAHQPSASDDAAFRRGSGDRRLPARSKHCRICDRCVARFDHHCGWMNNCIGEINTGYFMAFLLWHFLLCIYGAVTIGLILAGRLKELRVKYI